MSGRNLPTYRHSYIDQHYTDDESSESMTSYMDDMNNRRKSDRRDSAGRSIRSSRQSLKSSPQRSFDDDSESFSRHPYRHSMRERRASSSARSMTSRNERRSSQRIRSDSTQDSDAENATKALVQAKIREKVAQASSIDESSSQSKASRSTKEKAAPPAPKTAEKKPATKVVDKSKMADKAKLADKTKVAKPTEVKKTLAKPVDRNRVIEIKPKVQQTVTPDSEKSSPISPPTSPPIESPVNEAGPSSNGVENNEVDLTNIPDVTPGGPPHTPDYDWTCEYCTFVNEPNVKICTICCKTPSKTAIPKQKCPEKERKLSINGKADESAEISKEGRTKKISRKISFWPGTKAK